MAFISSLKKWFLVFPIYINLMSIDKNIGNNDVGRDGNQERINIARDYIFLIARLNKNKNSYHFISNSYILNIIFFLTAVKIIFYKQNQAKIIFLNIFLQNWLCSLHQ